MKKQTGPLNRGSPFLVGVENPEPTETRGPFLVIRKEDK